MCACEHACVSYVTLRTRMYIRRYVCTSVRLSARVCVVCVCVLRTYVTYVTYVRCVHTYVRIYGRTAVYMNEWRRPQSTFFFYYIAEKQASKQGFQHGSSWVLDA